MCCSGTLLPSAKAYKAWVERIFLRCGSKSKKLLTSLAKNKAVQVLRPQSGQNAWGLGTNPPPQLPMDVDLRQNLVSPWCFLLYVLVSIFLSNFHVLYFFCEIFLKPIIFFRINFDIWVSTFIHSKKKKKDILFRVLFIYSNLQTIRILVNFLHYVVLPHTNRILMRFTQ